MYAALRDLQVFLTSPARRVPIVRPKVLEGLLKVESCRRHDEGSQVESGRVGAREQSRDEIIDAGELYRVDALKPGRSVENWFAILFSLGFSLLSIPMTELQPAFPAAKGDEVVRRIVRSSEMLMMQSE